MDKAFDPTSMADQILLPAVVLDGQGRVTAELGTAADHGGQVRVTSRLGKGSRFVITLPPTAAAGRASAPAAPAS